MLSKECRVTRLKIDELELGERPDKRSSAHLAECTACREFQSERVDLRDLVGSLEPVSAPADFEMRLRARIARERSNSNGPFFTRLLRTPALAAVALFVVVAGAAVWVAQRNDDPSVPVATGLPSAPSSAQPNEAVTTSVASDTTEANDGGEEVGVDVSAAIPRKRRVGSRGSRSQDYSVLAAEGIRQNDQTYVNAPSKPVVFSLEDARGTTRKISLPPVTFGAQSLVDDRVPVRPVTYTANSRIW